MGQRRGRTATKQLREESEVRLQGRENKTQRESERERGRELGGQNSRPVHAEKQRYK